MIIIPILWSPYIKKEDAPKALKGHKLYGIFTGVLLGIFALILQLTIVPKIEGLYTEFSVARSPLNQFAPIIMWVMVGIYLAFGAMNYRSKTPDTELDKKLSNLKPGEMISTSELFGSFIRNEIILLFTTALVIGLTTATYLFPIFQLTAGK